jgi:hypothetical protein
MVAPRQAPVKLLDELGYARLEAVRHVQVTYTKTMGYCHDRYECHKLTRLLGMRRDDFIGHASESGIPYLQLSGDELRREIEDSQSL